MNYVVLLLVLIFLSCSKIPPAELDKNYRKDLRLWTVDVVGEGVIVLPSRDSYRIGIWAPFKMDLLSFKTCSREQVYQGIGKQETYVDFVPNDVEKTGSCPIDIYAGNVDNLAAFGFIDIEDNENQMPVVMVCGEKTQIRNGVSVCQGRVGLEQMIKFDAEMGIMVSGLCKVTSENEDLPLEGKIFTYQIDKEKCVIVAYEIAQPHRVHRHTVLPYDTIPIRK